ncbi:hypothetical protein PSI14_16135, partial [Xenorhabdus sp. XENO-2]|nr:hypothetical protein [Xenorhabdus anantnagensis]
LIIINKFQNQQATSCRCPCKLSILGYLGGIPHHRPWHKSALKLKEQRLPIGKEEDIFSFYSPRVTLLLKD